MVNYNDLTVKLKKLAKYITGKNVIYSKNNPLQDDENIYVYDIERNYQILHEIIHYAVASKEDRQKPNLRFGNSENQKVGKELDNNLKEESIVGYIQKNIIKKYNLEKFLFLKNSNINKIYDYLDYIENVGKASLDEKNKVYKRVNQEFKLEEKIKMMLK